MEALSALKHLQRLLQEGPEPLAERVMQEIASVDILNKTDNEEGLAASPLLREIQETAERFRVEVIVLGSRMS